MEQMDPIVHRLAKEIESAEERQKQGTAPRQTFRRNPLSQRARGPRYVSIGPFHWSDPSLGTKQDEKLLLMNEKSLENFQFANFFFNFKNSVARTRRSYPKNIKMTNEQFTVMLFLDAYFIINRLVKKRDLQTSQSSSQQRIQISTNTDILPENGVNRETDPVELDVSIDLIMLDNQIPFFVIEHVWKWLTEEVADFKNLDLFQHLRTYFDVDPRPSNLFPHPSTKYYHLLHLLYCSMIPERPPSTDRSAGRRHWIPSATELQESGIKFKSRTSPHSILDINFEDGILEIPTIWITESERIKLENLIDFEQSNRGIKSHFSNFVGFMSCLACDEKDVRIISLPSIIENRRGSDEEVQRFFQNLNKRCDFWDENTFLGDVCIQINNYHQSKINIWKTTFKLKLCSNPWITLSVIGAFGLFILTALQTIYTILSYVHPRN